MTNHNLTKNIQTLQRKPGHEKVKNILYNILKENLGAKEDEIALEERLTCRGRIDTLWGRTIFEIKRDLKKELAGAKSQLKQYIQSKEQENKEKYVGIATDGKKYIAYCLIHEELKEINDFSLNQDKDSEFIQWLESVILIKNQLKATPEIICKEIGQESPLCRNSLLQIKSLWKQAKVRADVRLKYNLWKKSVDIVYGKEGADESLFIEHTYLTIISKAMAYVAFFDSLPSLGAGGHVLLNGKKFKEIGVHGVVEDDFFSWIVYCNAGKILIHNIASHVQRFDFSSIEADILKGLYEGLIRQEQRHKNGEYYTPDWLAEKVCKEVIKKPLKQRVIDPACGSGAFLFHSIKLVISKAREQKISSKETIKLVCEKIAGIDIHPVAVIFSRITYLLAMLKEIKKDRPEIIDVPVYLGDSLQWQKEAVLSGYELRIKVPEDQITGERKRQLIFPGSICQDSDKFNKVLRQMIDMAGKYKEVSVFKAYTKSQPLNDSEKKVLSRTYQDLLELQHEKRNHIWGYVARNLTRPIWLSSEKQKADVVVGNPPWLRLNAMNQDMQDRFKSECESIGLWETTDRTASNSKFRTSQDISTYFFIMSAHLYMREKGTLAFVLPYGVMNGEHHAQFRKGGFVVSDKGMNVKFEKAWTFDHKVKNLFKVPSCVLFSKRCRKESEPLPDNIISFRGKLPEKNCRWIEAKKYLSSEKEKWPKADFAKYSDYYDKFKQGASLVPRRFCFVAKVKEGKLGSSTKTPLVRGITSNLDKVPWKDIEPPQANMESRFLMPVYTGQSIAPFRVLSKNTGVIPWDNQEGVMDSDMAGQRGWTHLSAYLEKVEKLWDDHGKGTMNFKQQINFRNKITDQLPISDLRVVYTTSGTHVAAVLLENSKGIIDTSLYWTTVKSQDEGLYLEGILNSDSLIEKIRNLQAQGQWGARHFSRHLLKPYFPKYTPKDALHKDIVNHAKKIKLIAQNVELDSSGSCKKARQKIRKAIRQKGQVWKQINQMVEELLEKEKLHQIPA